VTNKLKRSKDGRKAEWDNERTLVTLERGKRKRKILEEGRMVKRTNGGRHKRRNRERGWKTIMREGKKGRWGTNERKGGEGRMENGVSDGGREKGEKESGRKEQKKG